MRPRRPAPRRKNAEIHVPDLYQKMEDFKHAGAGFITASEIFADDPNNTDASVLFKDSLKDMDYCFRGVARAILRERTQRPEERARGVATFYLDSSRGRADIFHSLTGFNPTNEFGTGFEWTRLTESTRRTIVIGGENSAVDFVTIQHSIDLKSDSEEFAQAVGSNIFQLSKES